MKVKLFVLSFIFTLGLLSFPTVNAVQEGPNSSNIEKRLLERKNQLTSKLSTAQEIRLKERCAPAQTKLTKLQELAEKHSKNQDQKISKLIEKVTNLTQDQKTKGRDVSKIEAALVIVDKDNQAVQAAYDNYIAALSDAAKVDCQTDPGGFKASLEDAKTQFSALRTARQQLLKDLKEQLKPALKDFRVNKD